VRIAAQLIECASQTSVWSDRFERNLSDIFELQDEIAAAVASALQVTFSRTAPTELVDAEAYELFLRARKLGFDNANAETAALLEQAVTKAPAFAQAWAELARVRGFLLRYVSSDQPYAPRRAAAAEAAETSLRLDAHLGAAYAALSMLEPLGAYRAQESALQLGLSISPSDPALLYAISLFSATVGRMQHALAYAKQAYQLDPLYPYAANWYAAMSGAAGDYEGSQRMFDDFRARWPDHREFTSNPAMAAANNGDRRRFEALEQFAREAGFVKDDLSSRIQWQYGRARLDGNAALVASLRELLDDSLARATVQPLELLVGAFSLGLNDEFFAVIEKASFAYMFADDGPPFPALGRSPGIIFHASNAELRHDIRFVGLCAKLGLCNYWVHTERWPDCVDDLAPYYNFRGECEKVVAVPPLPPANDLGTPSE
jgi:tetratricopeptide (TPR) repeat protein